MTDHGELDRPRRRPGNQVRHDICTCKHWRSSHQGVRGCLLCGCMTFALAKKCEG